MPVFFKRTAVTRELFDMILELRLQGTSAGLAENIKQLHLLEYHQAVLEYLETLNERNRDVLEFDYCKPQEFSGPWLQGYNSPPITEEVVTKILHKHNERTRRQETADYLKTLFSGSLSVDITFKPGKKAVVVGSDLTRANVMRGGLLSAVNEKNEIVSWRLCQNQTNAELEEMLAGLRDRHVALVAPLPDSITADNCCHVRNAILRIFPDIDINLDIFHFKQRYVVSIMNGSKNPFRSAVSNDIVNAVLIERATPTAPARYWTKEEQEEKVEAIYQKWLAHGDVWSAAASKVHFDQLAHIRRGCLARRRQDIATDGSRIEGSHKGWNSIMRSFTSSAPTYEALGNDHVLRRNIRVAFASKTPSPFVISTEGSHSVRLVNYINTVWNTTVEAAARRRKGEGLKLRPTLPVVDSGETFGLVKSSDALTFGGLLPMKGEEEEACKQIASADDARAEQERLIYEALIEMGIDPTDFIMPQLNNTIPGGDFTEVAAPVLSSPSLLPAPSKMTATVSTRPSLHVTIPLTPATTPASTPTTKHPPCGTLGRTPVLHQVGYSAQALKTSDSHVRLPTIEEEDGGGQTRRDAGGSRDVVDLTGDDPVECKQEVPPSKSKRPSVSAARKRKADSMDDSARDHTPSKKARLSSETAAPTTTPNSKVLHVSGSKRAVIGSAVRDFFSMYKPVSPTSPSNASRPLPSSGMAPAPETRDAAVRSDVGTSSAAAASLAPHAGGIVVPAGETTTHAPSPSESVRLQALTTPLPCPPSSEPPAATAHCLLPAPKLSRSQRMWAALTATDPRAMRISRGREFFLFMDLRYDEKWASFTMSPTRWITATAKYNADLKSYVDTVNQMRRARHVTEGDDLEFVEKHPRALVDQLSKIEEVITDRVLTNNYRSQKGTTDFWTKHCGVITLVNVDSKGTKRKPQTCRRCLSIKYQAGIGGAGNHRKFCCSDGLRPPPSKKSKRKEAEEPPPWPQPEGIWVNGKQFHLTKFFANVHNIYNALVMRTGPGGPAALSLEEEMFGRAFKERLIVVPGAAGPAYLFPLYAGYEMVPLLPDLIVTHNGRPCLRVDCLNDEKTTANNGALGTSMGASTGASEGACAGATDPDRARAHEEASQGSAATSDASTDRHTVDNESADTEHERAEGAQRGGTSKGMVEDGRGTEGADDDESASEGSTDEDNA